MLGGKGMVAVLRIGMAASHWSVTLASPEYQTSLPHKTCSPPPFSNFLLSSFIIIHFIRIYPYFTNKLFSSLPDTFRAVARLSEVITFGTLLCTLGTLDLVTEAPNPARSIPLMLIISSTTVHHNDLTSKSHHFYNISIQYEHFIQLTVVQDGRKHLQSPPPLLTLAYARAGLQGRRLARDTTTRVYLPAHWRRQTR